MAIPVFTNYTYKHTSYRGSTGVINDITVSGGGTTIEWRDSNGKLIHTHTGAGPYSVPNLKKGTYQGTATNVDGSATATVTIVDKTRLYLSVDDTTTQTDCQGEIIIASFQHNNLGLEYELTNLETNDVQTYTGGSGEAHTFTGLCNGSYRVIATETQEYEYDMNDNPTLVPSTNSFTYETYLTTLSNNSGTCENPSKFIGEDIFESVGSTTESFLEFYTGDNGPIDGLFDITNVIIQAPKESPNDDSNTPNCSKASLKISVKRNGNVETNSCDYTSFKLDGNGKVLFTHSDGSQDYNITQECCSSLGYTPELSDFGVYNCRWQDASTDPCQAYIITDNVNSDGYTIFVDGDTGEYTSVVPTAECCTNEGLVASQTNGGYSCKQVVEEPEPGSACDGYTFSGSFASSTNPDERYALFFYDGGQTNSVPSIECCTANGLESNQSNGMIRCYESVPNCDGYTIAKITPDGYVIFRNTDGQLVNEVYDTECCTNNDFGYEAVTGTTYKCKKAEPEIDLPILEYVGRDDSTEDCTELSMQVKGIPDSYVKFRVTLLEQPDHGFINRLVNKETGENITPVIPAGGVGSYCEGSIYVGSSGVTELLMTTCVKPPLRNFTLTCVELKFSIFDYDNTNIKPNNHQYTRVCWDNNF